MIRKRRIKKRREMKRRMISQIGGKRTKVTEVRRRWITQKGARRTIRAIKMTTQTAGKETKTERRGTTERRSLDQEKTERERRRM